MSHFYAEIQGGRGVASRQGYKSTGIWAHIRGWRSGVLINGFYDKQEDTDVFDVYATPGSGRYDGDVRLGQVKLGPDGSPTWYPSG